MPNPFPGMNPYLEDPAHWPDFHRRIINAIGNALMLSLPYGFANRTNERVYQDGWDVISPGQGERVMPQAPAAQGLDYDPPIRLSFSPRMVREAFVEVRTADASKQVAIIEVLNHADKTPESGREEYQRQQNKVKNSLVHLVEIDLLRGGAYTVAPDERGTRARAGHFDYIVSLHRGGDGEIYDVWPVTVRERLPRLSIPLTEEVRPVVLDLQDIVNRIYEDGVLEKGIRYDRDPIPPLTGEDAAWADALLRAKGLR
jgi:hypothetical protein